MPGDLKNAYDYFGDACDSTPSNCNGNGNRLLEWDAASDSDREAHRFWQHLGLAKLIPGTYTGVGFDNIGPPISPAGPITNSKFNIERSSVNDWGQKISMFFAGHYYVDDMFGAANWNGIRGIISPKEAQSIDAKMDDGHANSGRLYGMTGLGGNDDDCSSRYGYGNNVPGSDYNFASTAERGCLLTYLQY